MRLIRTVGLLVAGDGVALWADFDAGAWATAITTIGLAVAVAGSLIITRVGEAWARSHRRWLDANKDDFLAKIDANTAEIARLSVESDECKADRDGLRDQLHEITQAVLHERGFVRESVTLRVDAPAAPPAPSEQPDHAG